VWPCRSAVATAREPREDAVFRRRPENHWCGFLSYLERTVWRPNCSGARKRGRATCHGGHGGARVIAPEACPDLACGRHGKPSQELRRRAQDGGPKAKAGGLAKPAGGGSGRSGACHSAPNGAPQHGRADQPRLG
jgi:hypothetical protein